MSDINFVKVYEKADADKKVDLICRYYHNFIKIIDGCTDGLCYVIFNDKIKNRKSDISELGVRVQNSGRHSDSTADVAISKVEIRKAVMNCDFSGDELDGIPKKDIYCEMAYLLRNMRADFELFNSQLKILDDDDSKIFLGYLSKKLNVQDIADEEGIQLESAMKKVVRIKQKVKEHMIIYFEGTI